MDKSIGTTAPTGMVMTPTLLLERLPSGPWSIPLGNVERRASFFGGQAQMLILISGLLTSSTTS